LAVFREMGRLNDDSTEYQRKIRFFLEPHREKFMQELTRLKELQREVRKMDLEFVNCHGEPSPGNVLSSDNNEVYLLDWDDPIFAPKEKDLLFFKDNIELVMRGYRRFSEDTSGNRDVVEFYGHMWNLGEIADYGGRILFENNSERTFSDDLVSCYHLRLPDPLPSKKCQSQLSLVTQASCLGNSLEK